MHPLPRFQMYGTPVTERRAKSATAPLDAAASARIAVVPRRVDDSSGSEHEAATDLSSLVNEYLFEADATVPSASSLAVDQVTDCEVDDGGKSTSSSSAAVADTVKEIKSILDRASRSHNLPRALTADVMDAMKDLDGIRPNRSEFRRAVMSHLRDRGHDAGLCKLRWDKSSKIAAGNYEYIDVVVASSVDQARFIVDVGFAAEFEVARPTAAFEAVRVLLPEVLVAPVDDARRLVRYVSAAARRSLKSSGFSVPPWRKRRFMMTKWFGPYKRTVNRAPESVGAAAAVIGSGSAVAAFCQTVVVGFAPRRPMATSSRP